MTFTVFTMRGSSGARRPNRTRASESGLMTCAAGSILCASGRFLIGTSPSHGAAAGADSGGAIRT